MRSHVLIGLVGWLTVVLSGTATSDDYLPEDQERIRGALAVTPTFDENGMMIRYTFSSRSELADWPVVNPLDRYGKDPEIGGKLVLASTTNPGLVRSVARFGSDVAIEMGFKLRNTMTTISNFDIFLYQRDRDGYMVRLYPHQYKDTNGRMRRVLHAAVFRISGQHAKKCTAQNSLLERELSAGNDYTVRIEGDGESIKIHLNGVCIVAADVSRKDVRAGVHGGLAIQVKSLRVEVAHLTLSGSPDTEWIDGLPLLGGSK